MANLGENMAKSIARDFSDLLGDNTFINRKQNFSQEKAVLDFDPKILYVSLYYAENRDIFLKVTHKHDFFEIAYVAKGECEIVYEDMSFPLRQGEAVLYRPDVNHVEKPLNNNIELYFMGFSNIDLTDFLDKKGNPSPVIYTRKMSATITSLFRETTMELKNRQPYHQLILSHLGKLIILHILRLSAPQQAKFISKDCRTVIDYIEKHFNEDINLDTLADQIFFSKHYLSHMFKEEIGVSPIKYLTQKRIEESKRLLRETDLSVSKIAETVGYTDSIYFSQFFKKQTGYSPNEYRSAQNSQNE